MGLKDCVISLDNAWSTYYPGQTINGLVNYTFDSPKKLRGINIQFKGVAETKWVITESRPSTEGPNKNVTVDYVASEEYFSISYYLVGNKSGNEMELQAGTHSYPFTCALPPTLPSSFEGEFGHVRYTIKATLDRPWKFDQETKMAFTVVSHMDLNTLPNANIPIQIHMEKNFCCCWCKSGPLNVDIELPVSGYCSGQTMPIDITCENGSNVDVTNITIKLVKTVKFRCQRPTSDSKKSQVTIAEMTTDKVDSNSTQHFLKILEIPPLPPSNLLNCSIIDLDYELQVVCSVSGFHMDLDDSADIIIGTVPLAGFQPPPPTGESYAVQPGVPPVAIPMGVDSPLQNNPYPGNSYPSPNMQAYPPQPVDGSYPIYPAQPLNSYPAVGPSAPQMGDGMQPNYNMQPQGPGQGYPQIAQPVFREGQFSAKSIHDATDNQHMGNTAFTPRYPTYGFVAP